MAILSAMLNSLGCYYPHMATNNREQDLEHLDVAATILISRVRALAAMAYRMKLGRPFIYPRGQLSYCSNLLHMMFSEPYADYIASSRVDRALNLVLLLHADHEQNCSTSTVEIVAPGAPTCLRLYLPGCVHFGVLRMAVPIWPLLRCSKRYIEKVTTAQDL